MNVVGTEGNNVRQIVPAEFNFLSAADRQVVAAMEGMVKAMYGLGVQHAVVASGLVASWGTSTAGGAELTRLRQRLTLGSGVVMWNGGLWEFGGGWIDGIGLLAPVNGEEWVLVMSEQVTAPSPVYGETIALDVTPHKRLVCTLARAEDAAEETQKVLLGNVMRLGAGGEAVSVATRSYYAERIEVVTEGGE